MHERAWEGFVSPVYRNGVPLNTAHHQANKKAMNGCDWQHVEAAQAVTDNLNHQVQEHRFLRACCGGVIESVSDETVPSGLDLRLSLVSDECALICNACTASLIEANRARAADGRK
jgi:hypothetical protein